MRRALEARNRRRERYELIRRFGYGVPSYERATASATNDLALMAQAEIQPFRLQGQRKFNECHYYDLPIPRGMLEALENNVVELKITLSYFIDPNPGLGATSIRSVTGRMVCALISGAKAKRLIASRGGSMLRSWKRATNVRELDGDDAGWMLGERSVSAGSLHCESGRVRLSNWRGGTCFASSRSMAGAEIDPHASLQHNPPLCIDCQSQDTEYRDRYLHPNS